MPLKVFRTLPGIFFLISIFFSTCKNNNDSQSPVAILGAFRDEISLLESKLENADTVVIGGLQFLTGRLSGKKVVVAYTGIGKVNAAMTTSLVADHFRPSRMLFTGIAGGINPRLRPADIVISERCVQHDLNYVYDDSLSIYQTSNPATDELNPVFFKADPVLVDLARKISEDLRFTPVITAGDTLHPQMFFGTIATGDAFIASGKKSRELRTRFQADAVEMEGAAVAQVCYQWGIPFLIIRSISDNADSEAGTDIQTFYRISAKNANIVVMEILRVLEN